MRMGTARGMAMRMGASQQWAKRYSSQLAVVMRMVYCEVNNLPARHAQVNKLARGETKDPALC